MFHQISPAVIDLIRKSLGALPDEPIYTLPPDERGPELSLKSEQLPDSRDWSHGPLGIEALHAKGIKGFGVRVAICDTGIDVSHPDLIGNVAPDGHKDFTNSESGYVDKQSHGTHVAGIVGSVQGNGLGLIGIAPEAKLIACKVLNDDGNGRSAWIAAGIRHAADVGADIINLSLGGPVRDTATLLAIRYAISKGCWVVCAAGNDGRDGRDTTSYPGHYEESVAVAAVDSALKRAEFSTINIQNDTAAPGVSILSTLPDNQYGAYSGTSMATPCVVGCLALIRGELKRQGKPIPTQGQILSVIAGISGAHDKFLGYGLFNAAKMLTYFLGAAPAPVPPAPIPPTPPGVPMNPIVTIIEQVFAQLEIAFAGNFLALMMLRILKRLILQYIQQHGVTATDANALSVIRDVINRVFDSLMARFSDPIVLAVLAIIRDVINRLLDESSPTKIATWNCAA